jgi:PAS domain S-box-containing protein
MNQTETRIAQLENEIRELRTQLEESRLPSKVLNTLFERGRMVTFYVVNDERLTVTQISDSISILGYSADEFLSGKTGWKEMIHPDDLNTLYDFVRTEMQKGVKDMEHEHRVLSKSGDAMWVFCNIVPEIGDDGKVSGFFIKIKDISKRIHKAQKNEIRLHKSEGAIRSIFNYSPNGIVLMDSGGTVLEWSRGYEQISGLGEETVVGKPIWEVGAMLFRADTQPVEELREVEEELMSVVRNKEQKAITRHIKHCKTGEHRIYNVLYFPVYMPEGIMMGGISRDVTEEVRARELLEENERNLEMIVNERTGELSVSNEELFATNEELNATNEELNAVNNQLNATIKKLEDTENIIRNFIAHSNLLLVNLMIQI